MCITMIHHLIHFCQPSGASGASYGQKMAILGPNGPFWSHFHTTGCVFLTSFAPRLVLLHVFNCDPPFDPLLPAIWGVWSLLWPKTAILALNGPLWSHFHTTGCVILTTVIYRLIHFCQSSGASGASHGQKRWFWPKKGPFLARTVPNQVKLVSSKWIYNPLNISDKFCYKSFCRL